MLKFAAPNNNYMQLYSKIDETCRLSAGKSQKTPNFQHRSQNLTEAVRGTSDGVEVHESAMASRVASNVVRSQEPDWESQATMNAINSPALTGAACLDPKGVRSLRLDGHNAFFYSQSVDYQEFTPHHTTISA